MTPFVHFRYMNIHAQRANCCQILQHTCSIDNFAQIWIDLDFMNSYWSWSACWCSKPHFDPCSRIIIVFILEHKTIIEQDCRTQNHMSVCKVIIMLFVSFQGLYLWFIYHKDRLINQVIRQSLFTVRVLIGLILWCLHSHQDLQWFEFSSLSVLNGEENLPEIYYRAGYYFSLGPRMTQILKC